MWFKVDKVFEEPGLTISSSLFKFLSKQLETLRVVNESRVKAYEQLEASALELQSTNDKLQNESASMKRRYGVLSGTIDALEAKCEEYQQEIDEIKTERTKLQREMATTFVSEGVDPAVQKRMSIHGRDKDALESDIEVLNERISNLKAQHSMERRKREELELELTDLIQENRQLEIDMEEFARRKWRSEESRLDRSADRSAGDDTDGCELAEDESYVLLQIDPRNRPPSESDEHGGEIEVLASPGTPSFLNELDTQYHELACRYDCLLNKCRRDGVLGDLPPIPTVQKAIQVCTEEPTGQQSSSAQQGEYKRLFAAIYSKLEESRNFRSSKSKELPNTSGRSKN